MSPVPPSIPNALHNFNNLAEARRDLIWLLNNLAINYARVTEFGTLKEAMRRELNHAVYALGRRREGHYVAIVIITQDLSVQQSKFIKFIRASSGLPATITSFEQEFWTRYHLPGQYAKLFVVHNMSGVCPIALPKGSMDLESARSVLQKM